MAKTGTKKTDTEKAPVKATPVKETPLVELNRIAADGYKVLREKQSKK